MMLLIVAIIAAIDDMLDPILIISAADILRFSLAGTTISDALLRKWDLGYCQMVS